MVLFRSFCLCLLLALTAVAAGAKDSPGCAALLQSCKAAGFGGGTAGPTSKVETPCIGPLLQGLTVSGLPEVRDADIAACNLARALAVNRRDLTIPPVPAGIKDGARSAGPALQPALPWTAGADHPPNIVMVLTDDFALSLMSKNQNILSRTMPNLTWMVREGVIFSNYFVTDSLCCPSRSSIFTGLLPHNSGVFTNDKPDGGFWAFMRHGDDAKTFAVLLHAAGYATAMMGKYLNGYGPQPNGVPPGWSEWAVGGNAYANYSYVLNHNNILRTPPLHLTDEISRLGQAFMRANAGRPFFLELATFSPHVPYVPPVRYNGAFPDITYPRNPAYGIAPDANAPAWLKAMPPFGKLIEAALDDSFRWRLRSDKGVDDMIGAVRQTLADLGIADNTYLIFTSDNGYHMGEYRLRSGKLTPFDTDINVPLVVVGPGIAAGSVVTAMAENIDLAPTFADIAGTAPSPDADGRSLLPLMTGQETGPWRNLVLVEHHQGPHTSDDPDAPPVNSGDPPTYAALRLPKALYVEYVTGEVSYYDLTTDPYELHNIAATLSPARLKALHAALHANATCSGPGACWAAQSDLP